MSGLTFKDIIDGNIITNPMEQQLFYLSRYFNLPKKTIEAMPYHEVLPMMNEMSKYIEKAMYSAVPADIPTAKPVIESIKDRSDILDFGNE